MVNAKLHIICGNCGCATMFGWEYIPSEADFEADVYIKCENCSTIHCLSNNAERWHGGPEPLTEEEQERFSKELEDYSLNQFKSC